MLHHSNFFLDDVSQSLIKMTYVQYKTIYVNLNVFNVIFIYIYIYLIIYHVSIHVYLALTFTIKLINSQWVIQIINKSR